MLRIDGGEQIPQHEVIETPSFGVNYILGGGLWSGRYHILWGSYSSGKTTFALHTMAKAQELGYTPVIVDAEGSITDEWLEHCGIDFNNRIILRSTRLEDILSEILPMVREQNHKYIFLIDSINSIVMEQFYKNDDSTGAIGIYARSQTVFFQKLSDITIQNTNHLFIVIAQQTIVSKGRYMVNDGKFGNAARHWATNIIRLSASDAADDAERDDDERILSRRVVWKIQKSKQGAVQGTKGDYWFSPQTAEIDRTREAVHLAVRNGIIEKRGAWFSYGGEKYNGINRLVDAITDEDLENLMTELNELEEWDFEEEFDEE